MFLTTEPSLPGKRYTPLRVISGAGSTNESSGSDVKLARAWNLAVGRALADIENQATQLGADGVIGVHVSTSAVSAYCYAIVMGTAIKFQP